MAAFEYDQCAPLNKNRPTFDLLPKGDYVGQVIDSEVVLTKAGTGTVLKLTWEVITPGCLRRKVWQSVNITNPSPWAQAAGKKMLDELKSAAGIVGSLVETSDLHNRPVGLRIEIELSTDPKWKDKSVVRGFFPAADLVTPHVGISYRASAVASSNQGASR